MTFVLTHLVAAAFARDDGPIGQTHQSLVGGDVVSVDEQRERGLVTLNYGGCSGTLLNRYWVLTAAHCVQVDSNPANWPAGLNPAASNTLTATWSGATVHPTDVISYRPTDDLDVALLFLGEGDFGEVPTQLFYVSEVDPGTTVQYYGQGINILAIDQFHPAIQDGQYRSGFFDVSPADARSYSMRPNASGQIGAGGDSGGPDYVVVDGVQLGIAGVHSTATWTYVANAPSPTWMWVNQVNTTTSAAIHDIRADIVERIQEVPGGQVWVGASTGAEFAAGELWLDGFCTRAEDCQVGDVDGDGLDDVIRFVKTDFSTRDSDVWVARSTGSGFGAPQKWADYFCTLNEVCGVDDFDGDGRDDLVAFVRTNNGAGDSDAWVALSTGRSFGGGQKWHDYFCTRNETCATGDVDGDGRADALAFVKTNGGGGDSDVWITRSWANTFGAGERWADYFCTLDETCAVGDVTGDGREDVLAFVRGR